MLGCMTWEQSLILVGMHFSSTQGSLELHAEERTIERQLLGPMAPMSRVIPCV